ncbi:hypothetical protein GCM10027516_19340 [Niabella aquatica]
MPYPLIEKRQQDADNQAAVHEINAVTQFTDVGNHFAPGILWCFYAKEMGQQQQDNALGKIKVQKS